MKLDLNVEIQKIKQSDLKKGDCFFWRSSKGELEMHCFHSDGGYGIKTFTDFNQEDGSSLIVNWSGLVGVLNTKKSDETKSLSVKAQEEWMGDLLGDREITFSDSIEVGEFISNGSGIEVKAITTDIFTQYVCVWFLDSNGEKSYYYESHLV